MMFYLAMFYHIFIVMLFRQTYTQHINWLGGGGGENKNKCKSICLKVEWSGEYDKNGMNWNVRFQNRSIMASVIRHRYDITTTEH